MVGFLFVSLEPKKGVPQDRPMFRPVAESLQVARARAFTVTGGKMTLKDELAGRTGEIRA